MPDIVIIADDLSGAADCGIVCAEAGLETVVSFGHPAHEPDVAVLAIDADTRNRTQAEAVAEIHRLVHAHAPPGRTLFRKIDSTLRGHMAAELAATLAARREQGRALIVLAPAFPATGRTTRDGHQHLHGVKLEHTELWQREGIAGRARIPEMLAEVGLTSAAISLEQVHGRDLRHIVFDAARDHDVLVFDAEAEADLQLIAEAAALLGNNVIWAGSAGLARYLPAVTAARSTKPLPAPPVLQPALSRGRPLLFVVGSASAVSRAQIQRLSIEPDITTINVSTTVLHTGPRDPEWIAAEEALGAALRQGKDVIVLLGSEEPVDLGEGLALCRSLACLVAPFAPLIGGPVSTGGETARAVLQAIGVRGLRLIREVETGVPLSMSEGRVIESLVTQHQPVERWDPFPVITKAGAFGTIDTLLQCRAVLHGTVDPLPEPETSFP